MKQDYNKTFQSKIVSCSVCDCSMTQAHYYKHKKTEKHQRNLNNGQWLGLIKTNEVMVY